MPNGYSWDRPKGPDQPPRGAEHLLTRLHGATDALRQEIDDLDVRLAASDTSAPSLDVIDGWLTLATLHEVLGAFGRASTAAEHAASFSRRVEAPDREIVSLNLLAVVRIRMGEWPTAIDLLQEVRDRTRSLEDGRAQAAALINLAPMSIQERDYVSALAILDEAFSRGRDVDDPLISGRVLNNAATVFLIQDRPGDAIHLYQRATLLRQRSGDRRGLAQTYNNLGIAHAKQGDLVGAIPFLEMGAALLAEVGDLPSLMICLSNNIVVFEQQHLATASVFREWFQEAASLIHASLPTPPADATVVRLPSPTPSTARTTEAWSVIPEGGVLLSSHPLKESEITPRLAPGRAA